MTHSNVARIALLWAACLLWPAAAHGQVMMQAFYWEVPSPGAGQKSADWWWDHLAKQAGDLRAAGISAVWLPPLVKCASGSGSVGYDPFDDYDLGSKDQRGTIPTRYGTREQLTRMIAILRANGIESYADLVLNHHNGDDGHLNFKYVDAYGHPTGGRFEKGPTDFHPTVPEDPNVADDSENFGRDLAHINSPGHRVAKEFLIQGDWLTRSLDLAGYRLDYAKGISSDFMFPFLNSGAMRGKFAVAEFWEGSRDVLETWLRQKMQRRCAAFDFPQQKLLAEMCNGRGRFDMRKLDGAGLAAIDPDRAVTFAENHDTDRNPDRITHGKELAYAFILTTEGYPCIFYRDYSTDDGCYKLKRAIDNLIWIHEKLAAGKTVVRGKDQTAFAYERIGGNGLLVALNTNEEAPRVITVPTRFRPGLVLHDYANHGPDVRVGPGGTVAIEVPKNDDGRGYVCYSRAGVRGDLGGPPHGVTQEFDGAADLDIRPAETTSNPVGRIWPATGQKLIARLTRCDTKGWTAETTFVVELEDPSGKVVATKTFDSKTMLRDRLEFTPTTTGWHQFKVHTVNPPSATEGVRYTLAVSYVAPLKLSE